VTPDTQIEGDFNTLTEVSDALSEGLVVEAKGEYYPGSSGDIWIVINVNFEEEEDDDDD
jgi:hypothetical protein